MVLSCFDPYSVINLYIPVYVAGIGDFLVQSRGSQKTRSGETRWAGGKKSMSWSLTSLGSKTLDFSFGPARHTPDYTR